MTLLGLQDVFCKLFLFILVRKTANGIFYHTRSMDLTAHAYDT